jgi:hypothetical protein
LDHALAVLGGCEHRHAHRPAHAVAY